MSKYPMQLSDGRWVGKVFNPDHKKIKSTKAEAQEWMNEQNPGNSGTELFSSYAWRWMEQTGKRKQATTVTLQSSYLRNHLIPQFGDYALRDITRPVCKDFFYGPTMKSGNMAFHLMKTFSTIMNEAVRDKAVTANPAYGLKVDYTSVKRIEIVEVTYGQLLNLEVGLRPGIRLSLWIMFGCGLRLAEVMALDAKDIRNGLMRVDKQVEKDGKGRKQLKERNVGEFRDVPVPTWLQEKIDAHIAEFGTTEMLFPDHRMKEWVRKDWNEAREALGLDPRLDRHMMRHIYVSRLLADGVPISVVARYVGHRKIDLTQMLYGHLLPTTNENVREISDRAWQQFTASESE